MLTCKGYYLYDIRIQSEIARILKYENTLHFK